MISAVKRREKNHCSSAKASEKAPLESLLLRDFPDFKDLVDELNDLLGDFSSGGDLDNEREADFFDFCDSELEVTDFDLKDPDMDPFLTFGLEPLAEYTPEPED